MKTHCLENLTIFSTGPTRTPFVEFFTKPAPSGRTPPSPALLRTLTIQRIEMPVVEFTAVLTLLTGLKNLTFGVHDGITNDYLDSLHDTILGLFSIVPNLHNLSLLPTAGAGSKYDNDVLADLLERRWKGLLGVTGSLASSSSSSSQQSYRLVSVELDRKITSELVQSRLDRLRDGGMRIKEIEDSVSGKRGVGLFSMSGPM
ncbi:hypothetical protein L218DRAFT_1005795 [Marasmius fiardii PR-910]|nr:hypothetical protein L218DRAFT_1005795 [Marasmius fiardii PR-910]